MKNITLSWRNAILKLEGRVKFWENIHQRMLGKIWRNVHQRNAPQVLPERVDEHCTDNDDSDNVNNAKIKHRVLIRYKYLTD